MTDNKPSKPNAMMATIIDLTQQSLMDQKYDRSFVNFASVWMLTDLEWHPLTEALVLSQGPYVPLTQGKVSGISVMVKTKINSMLGPHAPREYDVWVRYHVGSATVNENFTCNGPSLRIRIDASLNDLMVQAKKKFPNERLYEKFP